MTLPALVKLVVLKNIRADRFLTVLSIIGVALGIGLFTGVKVASDRAVTSFEADVRGFAPYTNYEILDTSGTDFPEGVYRTVRMADRDSFPVLKAGGYLPDLKETVDINGIDVVRTAGFLKLAPSKASGFRDVFTSPDGIIITKKFAASHSMARGDTLRAYVYDREFRLRVADIIDIASIPANTFIMDVGNFQEYFGKTGYLTRIDVEATEQKAAEIQQMLPAALSIEKKEQVVGGRKSLVKSFRYNLQFVSLIAILVGVFLLYNTIFISVVKRRTEIGVLRALGMKKGTVVLLFMIQGTLIGITGSALGILLGQAAAYFSVAAVEKTITTIYTTVSISEYLLSGGDILLSFALGIAVSLAASAVPAYEASRVRPTESSKEGTLESRYKGRRGPLAFAGVLCIASGLMAAWLDYRSMPFDFPFLAYIGILMIIIGFTLISPAWLSLFLRHLKRPVGRMFHGNGGITIGDMQGSVQRFSVALMGVAISSALIFALLTLIFSFRDSLKGWIGKNITADVYIKPASCKSNFCYFPLSDEMVKTIEGLPEVAGVDRFRTLRIDFRGRKIVAGFGERGIGRRLGRTGPLQKNGSFEDFGKERWIGVSKFLALKYGLRTGDTIELQTPVGDRPFVIHDIFSSYSTTAGFVYVDRRWLKEYWGLDDATQLGIYLKEDADTGLFIRRLKDTLLPRYSLEITDRAELRRSVLSIFDRTFAITYAIELISIIVSIIGVINTLLALVIERKREISIIRYLGGGWDQIRDMLVLSAGITGIAGIILGGLLGPAMSIIFIQVINKISFGWEIHLRVPFLYLSLVTAALFLTTLFAGLLPLRVARKIDPKRFISFE